MFRILQMTKNEIVKMIRQSGAYFTQSCEHIKKIY